MNNSSNTLGFETRVCPVCGAKIAKTPDNPEGICPTFSCPESSELYGGILSATDSEKEYNRKIQDSVEFCNLSSKYLGLYLGSPHKAYKLHFLYAVSGRKLVFIDDTTYTLLVIHEDKINWLCEKFPDNNYKSVISE